MNLELMEQRQALVTELKRRGWPSVELQFERGAKVVVYPRGADTKEVGETEGIYIALIFNDSEGWGIDLFDATRTWDSYMTTQPGPDEHAEIGTVADWVIGLVEPLEMGPKAVSLPLVEGEIEPTGAPTSPSAPAPAAEAVSTGPQRVVQFSIELRAAIARELEVELVRHQALTLTVTHVEIKQLADGTNRWALFTSSYDRPGAEHIARVILDATGAVDDRCELAT